MTAPCGQLFRLVRGGVEGRASLYRFDAEEERSLPLGWPRGGLEGLKWIAASEVWCAPTRPTTSDMITFLTQNVTRRAFEPLVGEERALPHKRRR